MKFVSLKSKNNEVLHIAPPDKGMDLTKPTVHLTEGMTGVQKNMVFKNGVFKTREGIKAKLSNILDLDIMDDAWSYEFSITETEVFYNGENKRVAMALVEYDYSHYFVMVYLIGQNGESEYIGHIHSMRTDGYNFYIPYNVVFYSGKPQSGGGIFAFVTLKNMHDNSQVEYAVYEVSENFNSWERAYSYYTPTVYINGRGDSYEAAKADNQVSGFTPQTLESQNLLYNRFYAYFTSDGYSSSFRLPVTNLANTNVICRVYTSPTSYTEWIVEPDKTTVAQNFRGATVNFNVDRVTGLFHFTSNGNNYSLPVISNYRDNNIRITAQTDYTKTYNSVVSSTIVATLGSSIIFAGGKDKNRVFYTSFENPLYFPSLEENELGSEDEGVDCLYRYADTIYAFKDSKIYSLKITFGKAVNSSSVLADNGKIFFEKNHFKIECINDKIGSVIKNTVCAIDGKLLWQEKNGNVYYWVGGKTICLSAEAEPVLNDLLNNSSAVFWDEKYYLFSSNKALVFDFRDKNKTTNINPARYYFEFPEEVEISGCANIGGKLILLLRKPNQALCYTASFEGIKDEIVLNSSKIESRKIPSFVKFKSYYLGSGNVKKNIHTAFLQLSLSGKTKIKIGEGVNSEEFNLKRNGFSTSGQDSVKLMPDLFGLNIVDLSIDSEDSFSFGGAEVYYTKAGF